MTAEKLSVAIDASRNRSGGAKAHLIGILNAIDPRDHNIAEVHVWSYNNLLQQLPDTPWLIKHSPPELNRSIFSQLWWQRFRLPEQIVDAGCQILLSTDAGTVCRFEPSIVMSRDMLSFEEGEMQRFPFLSLSRLRLYLLKHMQIASLRSASGALFLTRYAADIIQNHTGQLKEVRVVPHGIAERFRQHLNKHELIPDRDIKCIYVSNVDFYKHQWNVVRAIWQLREKGLSIKLSLVGGGSGKAQKLLDDTINSLDPSGQFVEVFPSVPHSEIPDFLMSADVFIFASSCENMPNTLIEGMASALPIACSNRGPMPEVLQDGGVYFDPEVPASIAEAIETIILADDVRASLINQSVKLSNSYSWGRCAQETWQYINDICLSTHKR